MPTASWWISCFNPNVPLLAIPMKAQASAFIFCLLPPKVVAGKGWGDMVYVITLNSETRTQLLNITASVQELVEQSGIGDGWCVVHCPHTTAAVTANEEADPAVVRDLLEELERLVPRDRSYHHREGNADAHIKAMLVGASETLLVRGHRLLLGKWQGLFFCEFDGPRPRRVFVSMGRNGNG